MHFGQLIGTALFRNSLAIACAGLMAACISAANDRPPQNFSAIENAAHCPTSVHPEYGLTLARNSPLFKVLLSNTNQGLTERRTSVRNSVRERVSTTYVHPLVTTKRVDANSTLSLEYETPTAALDNLNELKTWQSNLVLKTDGRVTARGVVKLSFLGWARVKIDECLYDVWRVDDRLELAGGSSAHFEKHYSPSLGVVLQAVKLSPDGAPVNVLSFDRISIVKTR